MMQSDLGGHGSGRRVAATLGSARPMAAPPDFPCASCGKRLPWGARFCDECGQPVAQPAAQPAAPQAAPQPVAQAPAPKPRLGAQTVIGVASPIVGAAPVATQPASPPQPIAPAPVPVQAAQPAKRPLNATVIGVASPLAGVPPASPPAHAPSNAPAAAPAQKIAKSTLVGVAVPGIAPVHGAAPAPAAPQPRPPAFQPPPAYVPQGAAPQHGVSHAPQAVPAAPYPGADAAAFDDRASSLPDDATPPRKPSRAGPVLLLVLALIGVAVAAFLVLRPSGPPALTSAIEGDTSAPKLVVKCQGCADGSTIEIGGKSASFASGGASIALDEKDLKSGKNVFAGKVTPKGSKAHDVELEVAIPFLVRASLAPLEKGEVEVIFDLAPDRKGVAVDGKTIEGTGVQKHRVVIPAPAADAKSFEREVAYEVLAKDGAPIKGSLKLAIPYAPLRLALPGAHPIVVSDTVEVSGRTAPGATVRVGDDVTLTADENGLFKGKAKAGDELRVRASSSKLAPRAVTIALTRAESVEVAAKALRAEAKLAFAELAAKPDEHAGASVATKVEVRETGEVDGRALAVGEARCAAAAAGGTCPTVRVLLPAGAAVEKGGVVEVLGHVVRGVPIEKGKSTAVEIDASIVLASKSPM